MINLELGYGKGTTLEIINGALCAVEGRLYVNDKGLDTVEFWRNEKISIPTLNVFNAIITEATLELSAMGLFYTMFADNQQTLRQKTVDEINTRLSNSWSSVAMQQHIADTNQLKELVNL